MKTLLIPIAVIITVIILFAACSAESAESGTSDTGKAGSMARFAITGNHLFTVDNHTMKLFNLTNPSTPHYSKDISVGVGIETIFPKNNNLFIGSQQGMYIYDISIPAYPQLLSIYEHIVSCDPVVVEGNYAYVTLHSEDNWCGRWTNELQVIDLSDLQSPKQVQSYNMTSPRGLGIDNGTLFVCDDGLKVYDATNTPNLSFKNYFDISAYDVIPADNLLLVVGEDGLYQYQYNGTDLTFLSLIPSINE